MASLSSDLDRGENIAMLATPKDLADVHTFPTMEPGERANMRPFAAFEFTQAPQSCCLNDVAPSNI